MLGDIEVIRPGATVSTGVVGPAGTSIRTGSGAPSGTIGSDGDVYFDEVNGRIYGPKAGGSWPGSYTSLIGPKGADGPQILSGSGSPSDGIGFDGDYFLVLSTSTLYGPKTAGAWPTPGVSLIGGIGPTGPSNTLSIPTGGVTALPPGSTPTVTIAGISPNQTISFGLPVGTVIHSVSGAPGSGVGLDGDYAIDAAAGILYGPKASGAWPGSGLSLIGPMGPTGNGSGNVLGPSSGSVAIAQPAVFTDITGTRIRGGTLAEFGALAIANALSELSSVAAAARTNLKVPSRAEAFFLSSF